MEPAREPAPTPTPSEEPTLTREPLLSGRPPGSGMRRWLNLLSLAVVLVLAFAGLQAWHARPISPAATPTPTLRPLPTPPTPAPTLPAGQGWVPAGPAWAQQIAFAPSAPSRGYVCGVPAPASSDQQGPIKLGVSDDTGISWQMLATPARGVTCQLSVNPANPLDVVLQAFPCSNCRTPPPAVLIRSRDGGRTWSPLRLPPRPDLPAMDLTYYRSVWMGGTLFLAPYDARSQTIRLLAMSTAGASLAWVLSPSLFASVPLDSQITFLYGTNGALYVDLARTEPCVSDECDVVMVSRDQGATWSPFTPTYRGQRVYLFTALSDERTLIGQTNFSPGGETRTYVRSVDDGATWMSLAPTPGNLVILGLTSSPDGALYAEMWSFGVATATPGIYLLGPGATSWKLVAAPPVSGQLPVLASDARGRPLALWSVGGGADQPPGGLVKYAL